jgi:hypothetical protein
MAPFKKHESVSICKVTGKGAEVPTNVLVVFSLGDEGFLFKVSYFRLVE